MPLYEYRCDHCAKVFEIIQKFSDDPLKDCPDCGAGVEKLMSRTSFQLKGTGWYATDYKKAPPAATPVTPAPATPSAAASKETPSTSPTTTTKVDSSIKSGGSDSKS